MTQLILFLERLWTLIRNAVIVVEAVAELRSAIAELRRRADERSAAVAALEAQLATT